MRGDVDKRTRAGRSTDGRHSHKAKVHWCAAALVAALILLAISVGWPMVDAGLREQGAESVREAVLQAATQCCAVEGSYPHTLSYLEEHYGLTVNQEDYAITYEAFASNVAPSVVVVPR